MSVKVFLSSNQEEFKEERKFIKRELCLDSYYKNLFDVFIFEDGEASNKSPEETYIDELNDSDIYIGLIGSHYGKRLNSGISATEYEYDVYTTFGNNAYFYIKEVNQRDEGSENFLKRIQSVSTYQTFNSKEGLLKEIKKTLKSYIDSKLNLKSFDEQIIDGSSCNDVDKEAYNLLFRVLEDNSIKSLQNFREPSKILSLSEVNAGEYTNGEFCLNNTGALFFSNKIDKFGLNHEVKMVRFNGNSKDEIIDSLFSKSSFFILLNEVEAFFKKNTKNGAFIDGFKRISIPEYPIEAVREAIVNAIAHRDYTIFGSCISFNIYDDRIEIISPGKLLYPLTIDDLGKNDNPVHRNPNICNLFSKTQYMEHVGTGITRMKTSMLNYGLPEPVFSVENNFFKVVLFGPNGNFNKGNVLNEYKLNTRQEMALTEINEGNGLTIKQYSIMFKISRSTALRDLNALVKYGLIRKINKGKQFYFIHL